MSIFTSTKEHVENLFQPCWSHTGNSNPNPPVQEKFRDTEHSYRALSGIADIVFDLSSTQISQDQDILVDWNKKSWRRKQ